MTTQILLPPLPNFRKWPVTHEELRARDLEVARLVLEGVANWYEREASLPTWHVPNDIRTLKVKHH